MAGEFETSVAYGLQLSKRIYYGKERVPAMSRSPESHFPTAVMVYAVVPEPGEVDNPDMPSYQPYVHGRCEPPALIPLHMHEVAAEVDCWLDYAAVSLSGKWRVHCMKASSKCDCRIAVPLGEQGSLLGVEVDVPGRSYRSIMAEDAKDKEKPNKKGVGCYIKGNIYTFKIPQVEGASVLSIKVTWSQKLSYQDGKFCLNVPFCFPEHVNPIGRKISKREKILLNVSSGTGKEIACKSTSHVLKELRREVGKVGFLYEAEVNTWSPSDFNFSYNVSSDELYGGVLLQSTSLRDFDERQMFCLYLFPGKNQSCWKAFKREVIFLIDTSGSMKGSPLDNVKNAVTSSLSKLSPCDSFNIIAFNGEFSIFSSLMEPATQTAISKASQWLTNNLIADGGTNILLPLKQALKLLAETTDAIPLIFLITDGTVEDERDICNFVKGSFTGGRPISPRIHTFGIGTYCNHYFLQMLAQIGRGHFDRAFDADTIDSRLQRLFTTAASVFLANITVDTLEHLDSLELFPNRIQDLSCRSPLIVVGRYTGKFPDSVKISGSLADMKRFTIDLKVQKSKDVPLDRVLARRQIDALTAGAWLSESKDLEQKVAKLSMQTGVPSEYTCMTLAWSETAEKAPDSMPKQQVPNKMNSLKRMDSESQKIIFLGSLGVEFGSLTATAQNIPPGSVEAKPAEAAELIVKAAGNCCGKLLDRFCCACFIQTCSTVPGQCFNVLSQICAALACVECVDLCYELCQ